MSAVCAIHPPAAEDGANGSRGSCMDLDLHGIVGIRLLDPAPADVEALTAQLGLLPCVLGRNPDIRIRFVPHLPAEDLRYVEHDRSGFTGDGFFILRHRKRPVRVRIPFDRIGEPCEIVCQSGSGGIPHLNAILALYALQEDWVALHASAFEYEGAGAIVFGWAHAGKTSALLAFAEHGARFVGDDTVLLSEDGRRMIGIPGRIDLADRHLRHAPRARRQVPAARLRTLRGLRFVERTLSRALDGAPAWTDPGRVLTSLTSALRGRMKVSLPVERVFGEGTAAATRPDRVFLMLAHQAPDIRIEPTDVHEIVERMAISMRYEGAGLFQEYLAYRFAFPHRANELLERADERRCTILRRAMAGKKTYLVRHPHGVALPELYAAMKPFCGRSPAFEAAGTAFTLTGAADARG